jgi:hypothetical protein
MNIQKSSGLLLLFLIFLLPAHGFYFDDFINQKYNLTQSKKETLFNPQIHVNINSIKVGNTTLYFSSETCLKKAEDLIKNSFPISYVLTALAYANCSVKGQTNLDSIYLFNITKNPPICEKEMNTMICFYFSGFKESFPFYVIDNGSSIKQYNTTRVFQDNRLLDVVSMSGVYEINPQGFNVGGFYTTIYHIHTGLNKDLLQEIFRVPKKSKYLVEVVGKIAPKKRVVKNCKEELFKWFKFYNYSDNKVLAVPKEYDVIYCEDYRENVSIRNPLILNKDILNVEITCEEKYKLIDYNTQERGDKLLLSLDVEKMLICQGNNVRYNKSSPIHYLVQCNISRESSFFKDFQTLKCNFSKLPPIEGRISFSFDKSYYTLDLQQNNILLIVKEEYNKGKLIFMATVVVIIIGLAVFRFFL